MDDDVCFFCFPSLCSRLSPHILRFQSAPLSHLDLFRIHPLLSYLSSLFHLVLSLIHLHNMSHHHFCSPPTVVAIPADLVVWVHHYLIQVAAYLLTSGMVPFSVLYCFIIVVYFFLHSGQSQSFGSFTS